jgi:hypothetical protein
MEESMKRAVMALVALIAALGALFMTPTSASAGSNNGTLNWYWAKACTASGGRLDVTNYDIATGSGIWQQYHIDADRAGGTGYAPTIYINGSQVIDQWNDFYRNYSDPWAKKTIKVIFANGSYCSIYG